MTTPTTRLVLTRDELLFVLALLGASTINGLPEDPTAGLGAVELAERLNSGEQALINRGLLRVDGENRRQLDDALIALVGAAVVPEAMLRLLCAAAGKTTAEYFFYATPELLVEQHSPRPGVFLFDYFGASAALSLRLQALLAPLHAQPLLNGGAEVTVDAASFSAFVQAAQTPAGVDAQAQYALDLAGHLSWWGMVGTGLRQEQLSEGSFAVAWLGKQGAWLAEAAAVSGSDLTIRQTSGAVCERRLLALTDLLFAAYHPSA